MIKQTIIVLGLSLSLLTACGELSSTWNGADSAGDKLAEDGLVFEVSNVLKAEVEGMHCPNCEASMQMALQDMSGVKAVKADHKSGTVSVALADDSQMQPEALASAIRKAKPDYKVGEVVHRSPAEAETAE